MYLRHRRQFGLLGLVGYLVLSAGYLAMFGARVHRRLRPADASRSSNPGYVQRRPRAAMGHGPSGDIGTMQSLFLVMGIGYSLGGLLFGIALFRARRPARWASALLAYGTVSALALAGCRSPSAARSRSPPASP